jgi:ferric-dicitrate binding protein FerR (iron transport regulator)
MTEERNEPAEQEVGDMISRARPRGVVDEARRERVRSTVHAAWRESLPAKRRTGGWWVGAAAAVLALALIGFLLVPSSTRPEPVGVVEVATGGIRPGRALKTGETVQTGATDRLAIRLDGGGSLRIDRESSLLLRERRRFELRAGAVYFDSLHASEPITIVTEAGEITDVGTQFEVRKTGEGVRVRVREGAVALARDRRTHRAAAGSEVLIDPHGKLSVSPISPTADAWDWAISVAPPFDLEGATLEQFLDWSCRELGCSVEYSGSLDRRTAKGIVLRGSIDRLAPDQALRAIPPTAGATAQLDGEVLRVEKRR